MVFPELPPPNFTSSLEMLKGLGVEAEVVIRFTNRVLDRSLDHWPISEPLADRFGGGVKRRPDSECGVRLYTRPSLDVGTGLSEQVPHDELV